MSNATCVSPLVVLQTVASVNPYTGGPAQSVPHLTRALAKGGMTVRLLTLDYAEHGPLPVLPAGVLHAIDPNALSRPLRGWSPAYARAALQQAQQANLVHNHGLWMFPNHDAATAARTHARPYLVSPRGMLGTWALQRNRLAKRWLYRLREQRDLATAGAFHATSDTEAMDIRRAGFRQPIAILPNGVPLPGEKIPLRTWLDDQLPPLQGRRFALFLSRLHPKKGVDDLLQAWARLPFALRRSWHLIVAGPDLTGCLPALEKIRQLDPDPDSITLTGNVEGEMKQALLHHAEFLVLPTKEENFGIVVAEALASGTAVITTHAAPWEPLVTHRCGWWIPGHAEALGQALADAMTCSPEDLRQRGERGRQYVTRELDWNAIASKMADFYRWVLYQGPRPDFVSVD
ncbi:MAG: glycosyltransferase [Candidatus Methylacidiphilales bacterium]|nr:glycosyltransferase [Candidatus Methylacidiphilales bacterium]